MSEIIVHSIPLDKIIVNGGRRPLNGAAVKQLSESIDAIGLREPITIQAVNDETGEITEETFKLLTGGHRLEAVRLLGWNDIPAIIWEGDDISAEMWEISENLHRLSLSKEERDHQIRRYNELLKEQERRAVKPPQAAGVSEDRHKGGRGKKGIVSKISEQIGVSKDTVERVLNPERLEKQREADRAKREAAKARQQREKQEQDEIKEQAEREFAELLVEFVPEHIPTVITYLRLVRPDKVIERITALKGVPRFDSIQSQKVASA